MATFCVMMTTVYNVTSGATDMYVSMGIESPPNVGWLGVGLGDRMAGSLMLLMASDTTTQSEKGPRRCIQGEKILTSGFLLAEPALSIRTTTYAGTQSRKGEDTKLTRCRAHFPPILASGPTPPINVMYTKNENDTWQEIGFVCYACGSWATLDVDSEAQPWIWARNIDQRIEDANAALQRHHAYGTIHSLHDLVNWCVF